MRINKSSPFYQQLNDDLRQVAENPNESLELRMHRILHALIPGKEKPKDEPTLEAERSLYEFMRQAWHVLEPTNPFVPGWHLECISAHLEAVTSRQIRNLMIAEPPRHAKSLQACVFWFCWSWIKNPGTRWLYTSYAAHLSLRDSEKCRTLIRSPWFQERWSDKFQITKTTDTKQKFINDAQGYRVATSVGGVGTGEGADYLCGDDPIRTDDAISQAARERVIQNWDQTISTRGNDPATVAKIIIMQRLDERDLIGHILAENRDYEFLCLPARYEPKRYFLPVPGAGDTKPKDAIVPTVLQRGNPRWLDGPSGSGRTEEGDPLWPERFNVEELDKLKAELGARGTAGQLQQRPNPAEGTIFQLTHFRYFTEESTASGLRLTLGPQIPGLPPPVSWLASQCFWFQTIDTALQTNSDSAWTVILTCCRTPDRQLLFWDVWRERIMVPEQFKAIMQMRDGRGTYNAVKRAWIIPGKANPWPSKIIYQAVESKASGIGLLQQARMSGTPLRELRATQDKVQRSSALATMYEAEVVWHRAAARATWLTDFEGELLAFPGSAYKDQVDVASYAAIMVTEDALTNTMVEGDLIVDGGVAMEQDVIHVNGHDVSFEDDNQAWWRR